MGATKRKKVITIETRQRTVIRQNSSQTQKHWCELCQAEVEMATPDLIAKSFDIKLREIYRRIEQSELHIIEGQNDSLFICINSLKSII